MVVFLECANIHESVCTSVKLFETTGFNSNFFNHLANSAPVNCKIIFYTLNSKFGNTFNNGIEHDIKMNYMTTLHFNAYDVELDELFRTKLPHLLKNRMSQKCMSAFLQSLRASLCKSDNEMEKFIALHKIPNDEQCQQKELCEIEEAVKNIPDEHIACLEKIFSENSLNYSISPNIFNYHKNQNLQQSALSIKQSVASDSGNNSPSNSSYKYLRYCQVNLNEPLNLLPGHTYVSENERYFLIEAMMDFKTLVDLITKNLIICFKKFESSDILKFKVHMYIRNDIYIEVSKLQIKHKLLQYTILKSNVRHIPEMQFYNSIQTMKWQSGFPHLLKAIVFSHETLVTNSKTFEIYGVFCDDFIKMISRKYGPVIHIRRSINTGKKIFYYALIYIHLAYKHIIDSDIPYYGQRQCISLDQCDSFIDAHQARRKCCTLIYHTYFKWFNKAIKDIDLSSFMDNRPDNNFTSNLDPLFKDIPLFQVLVRNIIYYNYIHSTDDINIYPETTEDQMTMGQIIIESLKSTRSLILPWVEQVLFKTKRVFSSLGIKNSPFDGLYDGPLINATSIRTCEKMTDPENAGKEWNCNILNTSMLLNKPEFRGIESKKNFVIF